MKSFVTKIGLALAAVWITYMILANGVWIWNHRLSPSRLSTPDEIRDFHDRGFSHGLYQYHPERQSTLRPNQRAERHGFPGNWMQTDSRGLAYLPPNNGETTILVLGDSVAFGTWIPYEASFPGVLKKHTTAKVFSGATESYSLRQTHDLFQEVEGVWNFVIYVWVPNDFYEWAFRETPFKADPRAGLAPPLDLFDLRDLYLRLTDVLTSPPDGLYYDEQLAWNPRRYEKHLGLIGAMAEGENLVVVLTYLEPQIRTGRTEPQERLIEGLKAMDVPYIDTLPAYREGMFLRDGDHVHFNGEASVEWSRYVIHELEKRGLVERLPDGEAAR